MKISLKSPVTIISIIWIIYILYIVFLPKGLFGTHGNIIIKYDELKLGDLGSFISGIFAPLAFIWLFENFRQQQNILDITKAQLFLTKAQLDILEEEKANLRRISKANFSFVRAFEITTKETGIKAYKVILNVEKKAEDLKLKLSSPFYFPSLNAQARSRTILKEDSLEIEIHFPKDSDLEIFTKCRHQLEVNYLDIYGYEANESFEIFYNPSELKGQHLFVIPNSEDFYLIKS